MKNYLFFLIKEARKKEVEAAYTIRKTWKNS